MNRVLIGLGVAALAAIVGLYALFFTGDGDSEKKTPAPKVENDRPTPPDPTPTPVRPELADRPEVASASKTAAGSGDYVEVITDAGVRMRDKRGRAVDTDYEAPVRRPFKSLRIDAKVLDKMGRALRKLARECKAAHGGDLGEGARVQPRIGFEIKAGQLNVTEADVSLTNIKEDGEFQRCFHSGAIGLAVAAAGHREVDSHKMMVPIDLDKI